MTLSEALLSVSIALSTASLLITAVTLRVLLKKLAPQSEASRANHESPNASRAGSRAGDEARLAQLDALRPSFLKKPAGPRCEVIREGSAKIRFLNSDGTVTDT